MGHVPTTQKFDRVAMDLLDTTTETDRGNRYILVIADYFSKYVEAYPIPDKTAATVADRFVEGWALRYGPHRPRERV